MAKKKRRTASKSRRGAKRTSKVASGGKYLGHYGWMPDVPDHRDLVYAAARITTLPPSVDLRPGCPPVYDQGQLGSCTANAIAAVIQFEQIRQKEPKPFAPSRLFIWGTSWGMQGYFTIPYAYLTDSNLCDDLWMIQMVA